MSGQAAFEKPVRLAALSTGEAAEKVKVERNEETELNGVEEGRDEMSNEEKETETKLTVKKNWQRQISSARLASEGRAQEQTDAKGERGA